MTPIYIYLDRYTRMCVYIFFFSEENMKKFQSRARDAIFICIVNARKIKHVNAMNAAVKLSVQFSGEQM